MRKAFVLLLVPAFALAQGVAPGANFMDNVRPFMSFIEDAAVAENMYGEGQFQYMSDEFVSAMLFGAQAAYRVAPLIEVGGRVGFMSTSPDVGDGESGLLDADVYGRYTVSEGPATRIVAGVLLNLPVGKEELGESNFDLEGFGGLRYALTKGVVLGHAGLRINADEGREMQFLFGGGMLYPLNPQVTLTGELAFASKEYKGTKSAMQLTPGVDYQLASGLKVRGALALGLSDGAPDMILMAGVAKNF